MFKVQIIVALTLAVFGVISAKETGLDASPSIHEICALLPGSTILRPKTCTNWIRCSSSIEDQDYEEGSCVFGLYFNKDLGQCDYKENVECPYETAPKSICSEADEGSYLADESDCSKFIYCKHGKVTKSNCPGSLVFNPRSASCVYANEYTCPTPKTVEMSSPICMPIRDNSVFADEKDCTKFSECRSGSLFTHSCDEGRAWDYQQAKCVATNDAVCWPTAKKPEPENTICAGLNKTFIGPISDGASCSGYYFCKKTNETFDRHPEHFNCNSGYFFDSNTLSCRDRLNVKCAFNRCEGMEGKYVNIAGSCKSYAQCVSGEAKNKGNCPDNYFFDERTQGCTPHVVSYAACSA